MAGRKDTSGAASLLASRTGCRLQACQSSTLSSPGAQARHWAILKLITNFIPPLRAFIVTVQWFDPRPTLHGLATQVARIIPVRLACSKYWLHFAQRNVRVGPLKARL
ncbi:hypothetical protein D3C78_1599910 [compost metagenome]